MFFLYLCAHFHSLFPFLIEHNHSLLGETRCKYHNYYHYCKEKKLFFLFFFMKTALRRLNRRILKAANTLKQPVTPSPTTMRTSIFRILSFAQQRRFYHVLLAVIGRAFLDFAGIAALFPLLMLVLRPDGSRYTMLLLCAAVLFFVSLKSLLALTLSRIQSRFQLDVYQDISRRVFVNQYRQGLLYLKQQGSTRLSHDIGYACYAFSQSILASLFRIYGEGILALLMLAALLIWKPLAGSLLCLVFLPVVHFYTRMVRKRLQRYGKEEIEARQQQMRTLHETFRGYAEIEIAQAFSTTLDGFSRNTATVACSRLHVETLQQLPLFLSETAIIVGLALLAATGRSELGLSGGVFAIAAFRLIPAIRSLMNAYATLQNASRTLEIVSRSLAPAPATPAGKGTSLCFAHNIRLHHLSYRFPDGQPLFTDLNWQINRGERVGIRGASGTGKSTLFNLMLGFLTPTTGHVYIDNCPLTTANRTAWYQLVGYVPQDIFILNGTLLDNIALGQPAPDRAKALSVLHQVQLTDWLNSLPQGLDTPLGEWGNRLSGGQKQRIGIARALYKEAEVLFFDEATSALDSQTEYEVNRALQRLSETHRELTLIIIAHRESSLALCQRILELGKSHHGKS